MSPKGRDAWKTEDYQRHLRQAGRTIQCSFGGLVVHRKSTDLFETVLIFADDDNQNFSYAFTLDSPEEIDHLIKILQRCRNTMVTLNRDKVRDDIEKLIQGTKDIHAEAAAGLGNRVRCEACRQEKTVDPAECLRSGWPECHGRTMTLLPRPS